MGATAAAPPGPHCVLRGHEAEVTAACFGLLDGNGQPLLFSAAADGEVRAWSLRTHRPTTSVAAHPGSSVLALHVLGGERLLSQGRDGFIRLWDVRDSLRRPLLELPVRSYNFCGVAPSPSASAATEWESGGEGEVGAPPRVLAVPDMDAQHVLLWDLRCARARVAQLAFLATAAKSHGPDASRHGHAGRRCRARSSSRPSPRRRSARRQATASKSQVARLCKGAGRRRRFAARRRALRRRAQACA